MQPETDDNQKFLQATSYVDWNHPAILRKSSELCATLSNDVDIAQRIFEWVRDEIPHSKDINASIVTKKASEVLLMGTGVCYAKTMLLAALLRAQKIRTGFCYQILRKGPETGDTLVHALNAIYFPGQNRWLRVDSRGNTGTYNAQFDINKEQLIFPEHSPESVLIYETIFTDPAAAIIQTLEAYEDCNEMIQNLPKEL